MEIYEPILLKNLIKNPEFFSKALPLLDAKHFKKIGNQELFKILKKYYTDYKSIPNSTELIASIKNIQNSEIRNSIVQASQEMQNAEICNTNYLLDETVKWIKDTMYLEALMIGSDGLQKKDDNLKLKARQILDDMQKVRIKSELGLSFDDIDEMIKYYQERNVGIRTQHKEFNKRLGSGFLPGTLNLILSQSGGGKSLMLTNLISGSIKENKNILLISLEMADKEIMKRVHANAMDLPINSLIHLSKTDGEKAQMKAENPSIKFLDVDTVKEAYMKVKTSGTCGQFFVEEFSPGTFSALQLESIVETYKLEKNIEFDIIYIDYIGLMKSDLISPSAGLYSYLKSIAEEVRGSAKTLNIPIISASQLNRCLSPYSIVQTNNGDMYLKDINIGDKVKSNNGFNTVLEKTNIEIQKMYKIKLKSGKEIICSGEHKFPTKFGIMSINCGLEKGIKLKSDEI